MPTRQLIDATMPTTMLVSLGIVKSQKVSGTIAIKMVGVGKQPTEAGVSAFFEVNVFGGGSVTAAVQRPRVKLL